MLPSNVAGMKEPGLSPVSRLGDLMQGLSDAVGDYVDESNERWDEVDKEKIQLARFLQSCSALYHEQRASRDFLYRWDG